MTEKKKKAPKAETVVEKKPLVLEAFARHKNGEAAPFDVATFTFDDRAMLAVIFDYDRDVGRERIAVFDLALLSSGEISFGRNSWRGDVFAGSLRRAIGRRRR